MPAHLLPIKPAASTRWDVFSLGEVLLRFDPGEKRITQARSFEVCEGGGEYNVARGLARCFRHRASILTALVDNPIGRLLESLIQSGNVDTSHILWRPDDGLGHASRNGLYLLERGFGVRNALGVMDRGHTAISQLRPDEISWDAIFQQGVRWFHTGGIFCGLADHSPGVALAAMQAAHRHGAVVSYDCNYRPSLWRSRGGRSAAAEVNRSLLPYIDVLFGHEEDLLAEAAANSTSLPSYTATTFAQMSQRLSTIAPNLQIIAMPTRQAPTANRNHWSAFAYSSATGQTHAAGPAHDSDNHVDVLDRVGSGDAFAAGLIHGLLSHESLDWSLRCGLAHGALVMTTPGDNSFATAAEVLTLMQGTHAHVQR